MTIGEQIKEKRKESGISMEKLAELSNLKGGRNTVYKYESGIIYPSFPVLKKISEILNCELVIELKKK